MRFVWIFILCLFTSFASASGFLDGLSNLGGKKEAFLPPDQAFQLDIDVIDGRTLQANFHITPSYYIYRDKIKFTSSSEEISIDKLDIPPGETKQDPTFGEIQVFHENFSVQIHLNRSKTEAQQLILAAHYMGCSENGLCYPPITPEFTLELPSADTLKTISTKPISDTTQSTALSEEGKISQILHEGNFWLILSFFFGAGLLLAFTPCIFPMIPILSGIIVGRGPQISKRHAFLLSLAYVLGMAVTYALAGVAAGYSGQMVSTALQTPAVLFGFAIIFIALSFSMFGFYELQLPSSLQSKLSSTSNKLHGGHLSGVFFMGALSAVIVGPCVAAPLAGALLYISQTHDAILGGTALFVMALGMGAPLLVIGTSAGHVLPKAGAWMESVKAVFGVALLGMAVWTVQSLLPTNIHMLLWAVLLIGSSIYLHALDPLPHNAHGWNKLFKGFGVLLLLIGSAYLIGALSGASDMTKPLGKFAGGTISNADTTPIKSLPFERVKSIAELETKLQQSQGKTVMLDFYADWCVSCIEMEHNTFSENRVQQKLSNSVVLQVDVTDNTADDKALLKRFGVFGPPVIVFFDPQGQELAQHRVTGYQGPEAFLQTLKNIGL